MVTQEALASIRDLIRGGRYREAGIRIESASRAKLTRETRLRLAYLANSSLHYGRAVMLLHREVRPKGSREAGGSDEEKTEYAKALSALGAMEEAIAILRTVDSERLPRASRTLAAACFHLWDWESPFPVLKRLDSRTGLSATDRIWGKLFLARCLVHGQGRYREACEMLHEVLGETSHRYFARAHWDALQLTAQTHYFEKNWGEARRFLQKVGDFGVIEPGGIDWLMIEKWQPLIDLHRPSSRSTAIRKLEAIQQRLLAAGGWGWEQARECDFYRAIALGDKALFVHVFYGSRYPGIRKRILAELGGGPGAIPDSYQLRLGATASAPRLVLETADGGNSLNSARLKPGQAKQRLLTALASDFYVPLSLGQIHGLVYPGEFFNPYTSADRVKRVIHDLRQWLGSQGIPLRIVLKTGRCRLASGGAALTLVLRDHPAATPASMPGESAPGPRIQSLVRRLKDELEIDEFTAVVVEQALGVSRPTAVARINEAVSAGLIERIGNGPGTRYRLAIR